MDSLFASQFQQINELLKRARTILVASHENPDADAVGSVLALSLFFKKIKIDSFLYLPHQPSEALSYLPDFFKIQTQFPEDRKFDLIFGLDYGDTKRLNFPQGYLKQDFPVDSFITIDHHRGDHWGKVQVVEPGLSSTCEMIYWWLKEISLPGKVIDREIATCLLTGIVADTGGFSHVSTSFKTLQAASDLLSKGSPLTKIVERTLSPAPFALLKSTEAFGKVLSRIQTFPRHGLVYSWIDADDLKDQTFSLLDFKGVSSLIAKESTANCALFLIEYEKGKIRGSLRSEPFKGERVDGIARKLGGGGHPYAAGFLQEGSIKEVLKKVLELLE